MSHPIDWPTHLTAARKAATALTDSLAALNMLVKATLARKLAGGVFELDRARIARLRG